MITRRCLVAGFAALGAVLAASPGFAQSYPSRNIRFIVPFAAGSATDALAHRAGAGR